MISQIQFVQNECWHGNILGSLICISHLGHFKMSSTWSLMKVSLKNSLVGQQKQYVYNEGMSYLHRRTFGNWQIAFHVLLWASFKGNWEDKNNFLILNQQWTSSKWNLLRMIFESEWRMIFSTSSDACFPGIHWGQNGWKFYMLWALLIVLKQIGLAVSN